MKILILGGCGYVGTLLVEKLIKKKHKIIVYDTQWFGNYLKKNKKLKIIKGDIRNIPNRIFHKVDTVIHLANIANDPGVELNQNLSWEVNVLATLDILNKCVSNKVKKFIFSSSGSVYGIKKEKKVTENLSLVPISTYNKTKMIAERIILSFKDKMKIYLIRPATVCGFSPRMRLDVSVNNLTFQALNTKKIKVYGGNQTRPNINIHDLCRVFEFVLNKNIKPGIYNAGFENLSILNIARKIRNKINAEIVIIKKNNDPRSYRLSSEKLISKGFRSKFSINDAIDEISKIYKDKKIKNEKKFNTVKWMKKLGL